MAPTKVLIVGGGVAGPSLAYWLSRIPSMDSTLIERSPSIRASGQQVDVRAQGITMLKKLGIEPAIREKCVKETGTQLIDTNGRVQAYFPVSVSGGKQSFTSEYEIMRGDIVKILYGLTEGCENVRHSFGTSIADFTQDEESDPHGKVHVTFQDGHREDFDIVVAADGTGSRTRRIMLGPSAPDPRRPMGGHIGYFSVPSRNGDWDRATACHLPGPRIPRVIMTRKDCPELTRVYMLFRGNDAALDAAYKSGDLADLKEALADIYQDGGWQCERFVDALRHAPEAEDLYCTPFEEVNLPQGSWSKGRVILIGDAAHSQTANGWGNSWALIGSYILAGEIATAYKKDEDLSTTAIVQAANNYEKAFRPIAMKFHGSGQWFMSLAFPRSRIGIWVLHLVAWFFAYFRLDQGMGEDDETAKWRLPEYPALVKYTVQG